MSPGLASKAMELRSELLLAEGTVGFFAGFAVHIITDPEQLCGLCLDYAQKNW